MKIYRHGHSFAFDRGLALRLCALYAAAIMSTVTIQQFQQDLATWLGVVGHGEPVLITEQGRVIAQLTPPDAASLPPPVKPKLSMSEWLNLQDQRMKRTFGNRVIADSAAVLDEQRADRE
jgi:antitoxin (DNA-binding transcriptional repressor) of toxin-antitoxin stability system